MVEAVRGEEEVERVEEGLPRWREGRKGDPGGKEWHLQGKRDNMLVPCTTFTVSILLALAQELFIYPQDRFLVLRTMLG